MVSSSDMPAPIAGTAAGVPYLALPPAAPGPDSAVVLAWHLMDNPRSETAMAGAVPLVGLNAWRIYFGLPLHGSRELPGGMEALIELGTRDAVSELFGPIITGAAAEFPAAWQQLRDELRLGSGPIGLLGGSAGANVAQLVQAESELDVRAMALVSPAIRLADIIASVERDMGVVYPWTPQTRSIADRLDFIARVDGDRRNAPCPTLFVLGSLDDEQTFAEPVRQLHAKLAGVLGAVNAKVLTIDGMGHAFAAEPGTDPAPQTPHGIEVDAALTAWFAQRLA